MRPTSRRRTLTAALLVATLVAGGCGDDGGEDVSAGPDATTSSTEAEGSTDLTDLSDLPAGDEPRTDVELVCAGGPFDPERLEDALDGDDGVETEDGDVADALRTLLAEVEATGRDVPDRSWRELSGVTTPDATIVEMAHGTPPDLWIATVQQLGERDVWEPEMVEPCTPAPYLDGDAPGYWWPATDEEIDASTTELDVLVQHDACDSGRGPDGRVGDPIVVEGADVVVVTFPVSPRDEGGELTCEPHSPAEVVLRLDEPLGDRELLDGSTWPAREPSSTPRPHVGELSGDEAAG